ncbi:MAG: glycoside hydrolase family 16 protein [Actinomycetales bacterium]|nr:MAG: glycoside hydrolase family 16 protein [Actinomycetales bacterium]
MALLTTGVVATSTPAQAVTGCGGVVKKADGTPWTCTFADNFYGTSLNREKWYPMTTVESGYAINGDCYFDSAQNIRVTGGTLKLTARRTSRPLQCKSPTGGWSSSYTAGSLSTVGRFSQAYGRYEIRAKLPTSKVAGAHSAWWLWPERQLFGGWPYAGEIDIAEYYTKYPDRAIPYVHYVRRDAPESPGASNNYCMVTRPTDFHTYTLVWDKTSLTISYDGKTCLRHTISPALGILGLLKPGEPFNRPFTLVLTQGVGVNQNSPTSRTPFPASMVVDYVRVWS